MPAPRVVAQRKTSSGNTDQKLSSSARPRTSATSNETPASETSTRASGVGRASTAGAAAGISALLRQCSGRGQDVVSQQTGQPRPVSRQQPQKIQNRSSQEQHQQQKHKKQKQHQHQHQQRHQQQGQRGQHLRGEAATNPAARAIAWATSSGRGDGNGRGGSGTNLHQASAPPVRAKKASSDKRTGDGGQNSRRNAPQPTPRQGYTLFDHLLANNRPPPRSNTDSVYAPVPRHGDKLGVASRPRLGQREVLELGGTTEGGDDALVRRDLGSSSSSAPAWPSSAEGTAKGTAKGTTKKTLGGASKGSAAAAATTGMAETRYFHDFVAASASSSRGGVGGREKGHRKPGAAANSFNLKPGKQRLGPRLKKLSTLKKRILLDRAAWWREHGNNPTAEAPPPPPPPPPPFPPGVPPVCAGAVECRDGDDVPGGAYGSHGGDNGNDELSAERENGTVVIIHHLVDEEDVEENDEHAEVVQDLTEMAETFGAVRRVEVPRAAAAQTTGGGGGGGGIAATVTFGTREEAGRARLGFHGRLVGGKTLEVEIAERAATAGERGPRSFAARSEEVCDGIGAAAPPPEQASLEEQRGGGQEVAGLRGRVAMTEMRGSLDQGSEHNAVVVQKELGEEPILLQNASNGVQDEIDVKKELREEPFMLRQASEGVKEETGEPTRPPPLWRVVVSNLVDEEDDLDDEDEYAEICADATKMMETHGHLVALDVPRGDIPRGEGEDSGIVRGQVVATFSSLEEAEACVAETRGRRVAGKDLDAKILEPQALVKPGEKMRENKKLRENGRTASPRPEEGQRERGRSTQTVTGVVKPPAIDPADAGAVVSAAMVAADQPADRLAGGGQAAGGGGSSAAGAVPGRGLAAAARWWRVVVKNLIEEEDLEDDDDNYDEVRADVTTMASVYGEVVALFIPQQAGAAGVVAGAERGEAIVAFGSPEEAEACARGLGDKVVGGKCLETKIVPPPSHREHGFQTGDTPVRAGDRSVDRRRAVEEEELLPSRLGRVQSGAGSSVPAGRDVNGRVSVCRRMDDDDDDGGGDVRGRGGRREETGTGARTAGALGTVSRGKPTAAAQSSLFTTTTSAQGKMRIPDKYKEAAALPKPPGANDRTPRVYVNQAPDRELDRLAVDMLRILFKFQERARLSDPVKYKAKRRLVMGMNEVRKGVKAKKVRLVIVAPNVDAMSGDGGLDDRVKEIIDIAREGEIPVVFALSRRRLGKALRKNIKISAVGVYSFDGANEEYKKLARRMDAIGLLQEGQPTNDDNMGGAST